MVQLIVGKKGKGKTKQLLDKVNSEVKSITGNIAYLDKSMAHMYELNNKVRMIDVSQYMIENPSEFIGFVSGIISQDHDLQQMYFDNFLELANITVDDLEKVVSNLELISDKFNVAVLFELIFADTFTITEPVVDPVL